MGVMITAPVARTGISAAGASDGRSGNAGTGAVVADRRGRADRLDRLRPGRRRVSPAERHAGDCAFAGGGRNATGRNSGPRPSPGQALVEDGRQDVLEEAPDELVAGHGFLALAAGGAVLVAIGHGLVVDGQDAVVGDGDAEGVAGEIVECGLLSLAYGVM